MLEIKVGSVDISISAEEIVNPKPVDWDHYIPKIEWLFDAKKEKEIEDASKK